MALENKILSQTTGDNNDSAQVFIENYIVGIESPPTAPFNFEVPLYNLKGATLNYYMQTTDSISTNLNNLKTFTFDFSANTESLSGITQMQHDLYRLDYDIFQEALINSATTISGTTFTSGNTPTGVTNTIISSGSNAFVSAVSGLTVPFVTIFEPVSGSTFFPSTASTVHSLTLPQKVKPVGNYTVDLFKDKSQYFIDSKFVFPKSIDLTLGEVQTISGGNVVTLYTVPSGDTQLLTTDGISNSITGGTFSGITIHGKYFCYFTVPQKPDINVLNDSPSVQGILSTYSPIFSFNNVNDGDYYKLQVSYHTDDIKFTGDTTIFHIPKQEGDANFIRSFGVSLTPNVEFIYRIGNTKEIINIFGIKQNVTTFGDYASASTQNDGSFLLGGTVYKIIIAPGNEFANCRLDLTILSTSSNINLGSDSPEDPSVTSEVSSPIGGGVGTTLPPIFSDALGNYSFGKINGGVYKILVTPPTVPHGGDPDFQTPITVTVTLDADNPNFDILFQITWGNMTITFNDPYDFE